MNHLDLCSGIGGFALAASWVWPEHTVAAFVEIDDYCQRVLRKHWPDAPIHDDLRTYDARPLRGTIDLLTGGYPCQPFSSAGKGRGSDDPRHLWPEVRRVVEECRPRWCLLENVARHAHMGLDDVLDDLESLGYETGPVIIPACSTDAPHLRERLWILAHADGVRELQPEGGERTQRRRTSDRRAEGGRGPHRRWPAEPGVDRMAHGVPHRMDRMRALGNAIVPQVAAEIILTIRCADEQHARRAA